jgi:hypothetical protein
MDMKARNAVTMSPTTLEADLLFVHQMLRELRDTAVKHDSILTNLIQMAYLQSGDILSGTFKPSPNGPGTRVKKT